MMPRSEVRRSLVRRSAAHLAAVLTAVPLAASSAGGAAQGAHDISWKRYLSIPSVNDLAWSPVGARLAYVANPEGRPAIYVLETAVGGAPRKLANGSSPLWSPDGETIAYSAEGDLWAVSASGGQPRRITRDPEDERGVSWAPDGSALAFMSRRSGSQDVWVVPAAGGKPRQLTSKAMDADEVRFATRWSPDGRSILYVSNRHAWDRDDLWLVPAAGGEPRQLTTTIRARANPEFSPDGRHIAVMAFRHEEFTYGDMADLYVVDAVTGQERRLNLPVVVSGAPEWSPDSRELLFPFVERGDTNLWRVAIEGDDDRHATQVTYLQGSVPRYGYSGDGRSIGYIHNSPTRPGALVAMALDGSNSRVLADVSGDLPPVQTPQSVAYRSFDGKYIHGFLYLPPGFDQPGARFPALVQVHGGGTNLYRNGFNGIEQALAQRGYVVLAINYRGSSGYGRPFQDLSTLDWCGGQAHDAAMAASYLRNLPDVTGKVGIYGYSYGGIMSMAAAVRHPDAFDAAVPMGGIYDWALAYDAADRVGKLFFELGHGGSPKQAPEAYERSSAVNKIANLKTPVLEMHGTQDVRAPFNQQLALAEALKRHNKVFEVHSYPEPHGFRSLENRVDMYTRLEKWFDKYLRSQS